MRLRLNRELGLGITASALSAAFLLALVLAVSPQLHKRFHRDSNATSHECAVTLIASGSYEHSTPPVVLLSPQLATQFATIPTLQSVWVETAFLGASIFEHAPPAVS